MEKQNGELKFEVGNRYKFADGRTESSGSLIVGNSGVFTCHSVDNGGDCWTKDAEFRGRPGDRFCNVFKCHGWCIATLDHLQSGQVIEVNP